MPNNVRKFKVEVIRTDEYIIEVDENIYNEEWIRIFEECLYPLECGVESIAEDIAQFRARFGERFQEGYGRISEDGYCSSLLDKDDYADGLNLIVISEDNDIESVVTELYNEEES